MIKKKAKTNVQITPADAVDTQLARYRSMRDFTVTAEPSGGGKTEAKQGQPFVIQKHAATRLHYDFRLGWNGVLKSWAVAKGPSYVVKDKRLAVEVEDHPMEYGGFEGIIPKGQYGGGTVLVWDQGTWEPQEGHTDVDAGLREGSLKIVMRGTKMHGKWALIRMGGKAAHEGKPNWLLIKEHDEFERTAAVPCITDEAPDSAVTGRTLEEIARSEDHVWNSRETAGTGQAWYRKEEQERKKTQVRPNSDRTHIPGRRHDATEALPEFVAPQLATQAVEAPAGAGWLHELKLDGYRVQARKEGRDVRLLTRTGLDWTHRMKAVAAAVSKLTDDTLLLDGEVVVLREDGTTSFADLQAAFQDGAHKPLTYFVFDLLHRNGSNMRDLPLLERKGMLAEALAGTAETVQISEHLDTGGGAMFRKACELHAEGIISKRAGAKYTSGRTSDWLKLKCVREQEFVIGGFTLPEKSRKGTQAIGALLLGYYQGKRLVYAGRTGTGFTARTHRAMREKLDALRAQACPFDRPPAEARRGAVWVTPDLVAQVNFATWTADNLVRQASFKGLREDKAAGDVRKEEAVSTPDVIQNVAAEAERRTASEGTSRGSTSDGGRLEQAPVRLTHPDKVVDTVSGLTKRGLADYYWAVAERMLPHVAGRPLSLVRCPEGSEKPCFFQKHTNVMLSAGIASVNVPDKKTGKMEPFITLSTAEALAGLAQMGVLEVHPWGSRNEDLEHPDRLTIDLDPDEAIAWEVLAESADEVRGRLKKLGLKSFLKTTGGKGLHVVVPILPGYDWATIKRFAHGLVLDLEKRHPSRYLTKMSKAARKGRIYLDYLRNERGATAVAAYSPRARAGMAISLPLEWNELRTAERPVFRVAEFSAWRERLGRNPWRGIARVDQKLSAAMLTEVGVQVDTAYDMSQKRDSRHAIDKGV